MKAVLRILFYAKEWKWIIAFSTFTLILTQALQLTWPIITRNFIDFAVSDAEFWSSTFVILSVLLVCTFIGRAIFSSLHEYYSHDVGERISHKMRLITYNHIQTFTPRWFQKTSTGQTVARLITDTTRIETFISHTIPDFISSIVMFVGATIFLFYINTTLALLLMAPVPIIFVVSFIARRIRRYWRIAKEIEGELAGSFTDNIQGMKEIQVFNRQGYETKRIGEESIKLKNAWMKGVFWRAFVNPVVFLMESLGRIITVIVGVILLANNTISVADLTAVLMYMYLAYEPIARFARLFEDLQQSITSSERIFKILDTPTEIQDTENARDVGALKGNIKFDDVVFKYTNEDAHKNILDQINFDVKANTMVALVGPTGAGKTTVTSILARFYDIQDGAVTIDNIDIRDMTIESLRNNISIVLQDVYLFNGPIGENIGYGKEGATREEIIAAAKSAELHDFVVGLPHGYDTIVGERGTRLSGGQKQRVALARAILRDSPILILDEATSAVDNETERKIQAAIARISGSRTMVVIAHRLSTIKNADQILYIEDGKVKERGTYDELIKANKCFAKLAKATF
ncbi:MAG: ABC transporter ATP-binding protein/permease [Firmicutes bacterium]|nr:ABC transporter ATP-binding protein/permease [Bacillota bacterium]